MRQILTATAAALFFSASAAQAETAPNIDLRAGTPVLLVTTEEISSKTAQKGQLIQMETKSDIRENGVLLIPARTKAVGQVANVEAKGTFGQSGKLLVQPLYIRVGDNTVRLTGKIEEKASASAGAIVGLALLSAGFTGRSAIIPVGSELNAETLNQVSLPSAEPK